MELLERQGVHRGIIGRGIENHAKALLERRFNDVRNGACFVLQKHHIFRLKRLDGFAREVC